MTRKSKRVDILKNVALIFQSYNLLNYMTALENVTMAMELAGTYRGRRSEMAMQLLQDLGLKEDEAKRNVMQIAELTMKVENSPEGGKGFHGLRTDHLLCQVVGLVNQKNKKNCRKSKVIDVLCKKMM